MSPQILHRVPLQLLLEFAQPSAGRCPRGSRSAGGSPLRGDPWGSARPWPLC